MYLASAEEKFSADSKAKATGRVAVLIVFATFSHTSFLRANQPQTCL